MSTSPSRAPHRPRRAGPWVRRALLLGLAACSPDRPSQAHVYRTALETGDCATLTDPTLRDDCVLAHVDGTKPELCATLSTERMRDECRFQLAELARDPTLCAQAGQFRDDCALHLVSQGFLELAPPGTRPGMHEEEVAALIVAGGLNVNDRRPWGAWYRQALQASPPLDRSACDSLTDPMHQGICRAAGLGLYHDRLNTARDHHRYPCDGSPLPEALQYAPDPEIDAVLKRRRAELCRGG